MANIKFNAAVLRVIDFLVGDRSTGKCFCPRHEHGMRPSLQVGNGNEVPVVLHCFGLNSKRHDLDIIAHLRANGVWPTTGKFEGARASSAAEEARPPEERRRYALRIWNDLKHGGGREMAALLQDYMKARGLNDVPVSAMLTLPPEYLRARGDDSEVVASHDPGMVLPIRNKEGKLHGIHVAWLNPDLTAKRAGDMPYQTYGLLKGNFVPVTRIEWGKPIAKLIIAEGWATAAAAAQLTGLPAVAAGGKGNLAVLDLPVASEYIIAPDNDDDHGSRRDAGLLAQRLVGCIVRIAMPDRPEGESGYDWDDALTDVGTDDSKLAELARSIVAAPLFDAVMTDEEKRELRINALAALKLDDDSAYEEQRMQAAKDLHWRVSFLDEKVEQRCKLLETTMAAPPKPDMELLAASARDIIASKNVLGMLAMHVEKFIAGEGSLAKLLYLVATSRLFDKGMHAAIKGASSGGKSELRKMMMRYFPPESVIEFTALSEKALLYFKDDFQHKILSMSEARGEEEAKFQDYILRELMSENEIKYLVPVKVGGKVETDTVVKHGPVVFIVTTTRNSLNPENETRMLSLEIDDSEAQTKKVLQKVALIEGYNRQPAEAEFKMWHDYQRWLAAGECRVVVPFASTVGKLMGSTKSVRLRRDFGQMLRAVKAHALLHREHRAGDDAGAIKATLEDYAAVLPLMADLLATASELKMRAAIAEAVNAVKAAGGDGVTVREVADELDLDRSAAFRRLRAAEAAGYIVNSEERKGRAARYRVGEEPKEGGTLLPTPEAVREEIKRSWRGRTSAGAMHGPKTSLPRTPLKRVHTCTAGG
jgi:hypothetical protein